MTKKIPNFNSISTLIDRLIIEHVKLSQFTVKYEEKSYINGTRNIDKDIVKKIDIQKNIF